MQDLYGRILLWPTLPEPRAITEINEIEQIMKMN